MIFKRAVDSKERNLITMGTITVEREKIESAALFLLIFHI